MQPQGGTQTCMQVRVPTYQGAYEGLSLYLRGKFYHALWRQRQLGRMPCYKLLSALVYYSPFDLRLSLLSLPPSVFLPLLPLCLFICLYFLSICPVVSVWHENLEALAFVWKLGLNPSYHHPLDVYRHLRSTLYGVENPGAVFSGQPQN